MERAAAETRGKRIGGDAEPCPGCGAIVPRVEGPTHRYLVSAPGCWRAFGEVLAAEFGDPLFFPVHAMTVDTYALQHPGTPSQQTIRSAAIHLAALCAVLERGYDARRSMAVRRLLRERFGDELTWLEPPASKGAVTVLDVVGAADGEAHRERVERWAAATWMAWGRHHDVVRSWIDRLESR